jgi:hypothetical protein
MGGFEERDPHGGVTGPADGTRSIDLAGLITPRRQAEAWARGLLARAHKNVVVVALANKLARIAWAVLAHGCAYDAGGQPVAI